MRVFCLANRSRRTVPRRVPALRAWPCRSTVGMELPPPGGYNQPCPADHDTPLRVVPMPPDTVASLADALRHSRLLEPAQLDELTQTLAAQPTEPRALARELVRRGWLTPYQANQLVQGRGHDLLLGS